MLTNGFNILLMGKLLNILHIGWGFYPWRKGGLILYARDLMNEQLKSGHQVFYFCAGRKLPMIKKSFLYSWKTKNLQIYEIINSPISHRGDSGTLHPGLTIKEGFSEKFFKKVISKTRPDIIHIHELAGLPSSIIDIIKDQNDIPCLMTLADYFLLCPCLKLFDHFTKKNCTIQGQIGFVCSKCILAGPDYFRSDVFESASLLLTDIETRFDLSNNAVWLNFRSLCFKIYAYLRDRQPTKKQQTRLPGSDKRQEDKKFIENLQQRRTINIERLSKITRLVARSQRVKQIYETYLDVTEKVFVLNPYLKHIDKIIPKHMGTLIHKVKFVTLNGFISRQKGGKLLMDAVVTLNKQGYTDLFEMHSLGQIRQKYKDRLTLESNFFDHGHYDAETLNSLLEPMHVGIVPSVWEEVFGYVGLELLAKGLPVIANNKGGITDYLIHNVNGYLNVTCSLQELIHWMKNYINNRHEIVQHNKNILVSSNLNYANHYSQIMNIYSMVIKDSRKPYDII